MADPIVPRPAIARGQLLHQVGEVQFTNPAAAIGAWSAVRAEQDGDIDRLRGELAIARAAAKVSAEESAAWRKIAEEQSQEVGRLRALLRGRKSGGVR